MKNQKLISLGAGMAAVASIAGGTIFALSSNAGSSSALGLSDAQVNTIATNVAATPEADRDAYIEKLAANLGVDAQKLKDAIKSTNLQVLDEKVADGSISSTDADALRTRIEGSDGTFFGIGGHGGRGDRGPGGPGGPGVPGGPGMGVNQDDLATFLGIDAATLRTELQTKSLATVATDHGKSADALKTFLTESVKTSLAQAVSDGKMTQAQADERVAAFSANLDTEINEIHTMGDHGPRGGMTPPNGGTAPAPAPTN
ncbi:MAG: hypothetical protein ABI577_14135 [bacterium]